jgi:hypothetical protein
MPSKNPFKKLLKKVKSTAPSNPEFKRYMDTKNKSYESGKYKNLMDRFDPSMKKKPKERITGANIKDFHQQLDEQRSNNMNRFYRTQRRTNDYATNTPLKKQSSQQRLRLYNR